MNSYRYLTENKQIEKCTAHKDRFCESGNVFPQTVLWKFGSSYLPKPV